MYVIVFLLDCQVHFHRGCVFFSICMGVNDCLSDGVGFVLAKMGRILTYIAAVAVGIHLCKDGCGRIIIADITRGIEPMTVADVT